MSMYIYVVQIGKKYSHHTYPIHKLSIHCVIIATLQRFKKQDVYS